MRKERSGELTHEVRCLLRARLRIAAWTLFGGFLLFLIQHLVVVANGATYVPHLFALHVACTVAMGCLAVLLTTAAWNASLKTLRWLEVAIFGIPAAFFIWIDFFDCQHHIQDATPEMLSAIAAETAMPWLRLIFVYSLFIPASWKRAAVIIGLMGVAPLLVTLSANALSTNPDRWHFHGDLITMLLWTCVPAVAGIYGANRIGHLRREAVEARQLGSYRLNRLIGAGGMGEVYLAEHIHLKRPCAIKLIRPERMHDPNALARFESEVQATAKLTHWNTVEIYDYGRADDGTFYYVMEYLPGLTLQDIVDRFGPMSPGRAIYLLRQVCDALREAHSFGLVHRDIKPGNIFAARRGGYNDVAKIVDFGLVKSVDRTDNAPNVTMEGMVVGSPLYTAPEMTIGEGHPDPRVDIYSLGVTAYFLVTGRPLFPYENPLKLLFAHASETPTPPSAHRPDLPSDLEAVILRAIEKNPRDRYQDVGAMIDALDSCESARSWTHADAAAWWSDSDRLVASLERSDQLLPTTSVEIPRESEIENVATI
jgi:serine/threonine protein kinase